MLKTFFSHTNTFGPWVAISPRKFIKRKPTEFIERTWHAVDSNAKPIQDKEFATSCSSLTNWLKCDTIEGLTAVYTIIPVLWNHAVTLLNEIKPWDSLVQRDSVEKFGELLYVSIIT
jgi:hypothetical protein